MGLTPALPPSLQAARMDALRELWRGAGLAAIDSRTITASRSFASFEEFWTLTTAMSSMRAAIARMTPADASAFRSRVQARLPTDAAGRITYQARANAIQGRVPD